MKKNRTITLLVLLVLAVLFVACKNEEQLAEKVVETEESSSQISDAQALESDLEEDEFEAYVKSTLNLSDNEIIEKTEWIEDQVCYRVAVERAIEVEGEYKHLSDYIFVKGDTFKCIKVTYPSKLETMDADRYVYDACDFAVIYEDITFDGQKDIVISLGHQGTSGTCVSCAYVFEENDYVYVKSFEGIPNYEINGEQKCIDGFYKDETYQYHYWNGEFVELKQDISEPALSKEIIDSYGYEDGYSALIFHIPPQTVAEYDEFYVVDMVYAQAIEVPANLAIE